MSNLDKTLDDRGKDYGDYKEQWKLSQALKRLVHQPNMNTMAVEALDMIMLKISRLVHGNSEKVDTWLDIEGYARIARQHMESRQENMGGSPTTCHHTIHIDSEATTNFPKTLDNAQRRIDNWINKILPDRTPEMALQKLIMEEIPELLNGGIDDPMEWADVFILVLDCAKLRNIDIIEAVHAKMDINENRDWEINKSGVLHHVD